jgi:hypothetical protein
MMQASKFSAQNSHGHAKESLQSLSTVWAHGLKKKFASPDLGYIAK